jgi:hypothetical protein
MPLTTVSLNGDPSQVPPIAIEVQRVYGLIRSQRRRGEGVLVTRTFAVEVALH